MEWVSMDWVFHLLVILIFLVLKGFFSGSELAMVNADKIHLRHIPIHTLPLPTHVLILAPQCVSDSYSAFT